ncbi:MAG TPA: hypothetical protein VMR62_01225, partial [Bryobacteraceae bacterium]|nr:hypothetical protein [Bryobacteraceae bacterium]
MDFDVAHASACCGELQFAVAANLLLRLRSLVLQPVKIFAARAGFWISTWRTLQHQRPCGPSAVSETGPELRHNARRRSSAVKADYILGVTMPAL